MIEQSAVKWRWTQSGANQSPVVIGTPSLISLKNREFNRYSRPLESLRCPRTRASQWLSIEFPWCCIRKFLRREQGPPLRLQGNPSSTARCGIERRPNWRKHVGADFLRLFVGVCRMVQVRFGSHFLKFYGRVVGFTGGLTGRDTGFWDGLWDEMSIYRDERPHFGMNCKRKVSITG